MTNFWAKAAQGNGCQDTQAAKKVSSLDPRVRQRRARAKPGARIGRSLGRSDDNPVRCLTPGSRTSSTAVGG
jgi:hypothetical protein